MGRLLRSLMMLTLRLPDRTATTGLNSSDPPPLMSTRPNPQIRVMCLWTKPNSNRSSEPFSVLDSRGAGVSLIRKYLICRCSPDKSIRQIRLRRNGCRWYRRVNFLPPVDGLSMSTLPQAGVATPIRCGMFWIRSQLARNINQWFDDTWLVDSTPIGCGRSHTTTQHCDLAGWATYGRCASHSRWFWGLRLHLIATCGGLIMCWELTPANADERQALRDMLDDIGRPDQTIIADKGYASKPLETDLNQAGICLIRPTRKNEPPRPGTQYLRSLHQMSANR